MGKLRNRYEITEQYTDNVWSRPQLDSSQGEGGKRVFGVAHATGSAGATAEDEYSFYDRKSYWSSVHMFIDDKILLNIVPFDELVHGVQQQKPYDDQRFGAEANYHAIQAEFCFGSNIDFDKAYDRYVWFWAFIFDKYGWTSVEKLLAGHFQLDPARRTDPVTAFGRYGVTWDEFLADVQNYVDRWDEDDDGNAHVPATYTIKAGDTFWGIAEKYGLSVDVLQELNPKKKVRSLKIGDEIRLRPQHKNDHEKQHDSSNDYKKFNHRKRAVATGNVWVHDEPNFDTSSRVEVMKEGETTWVYGKTEDMYNIGGGEYVSSKYLKLVKQRLEYPLPDGVLSHGDGFNGGDEARRVKMLQRALNGIYFDCGAVDGKYGDGTENAVYRVQLMSAIADDGVYGHDTREWMENREKELYR